MTENLFTKHQLDEIIQKSRDYDYTNYKEIHLGFLPTDIIRQDRETKLILAKGNLDTGYEHIISRHFGSEMKPYWKKGDDTLPSKLDNPTIFKNSIPYDIVKYAKQIFNDYHLTDNRKNELFNVYEGLVNYHDNINVKSRLVVYKEQPVVHTFFISQLGKFKNKNRQKQFFRGPFTTEEDIMNSLLEYSCLYYDSNNEIVFQYFETHNLRERKTVIKIVIDTSEFEIYNSDIIKQVFAPPFGALIKGMIVNEEYEKLAIDKYLQTKSST